MTHKKLAKNIEIDHGNDVAPGEQISPFGDGYGHIPPVDKVAKRETVLDPEVTYPTEDISADGNENLTEDQEEDEENVHKI